MVVLKAVEETSNRLAASVRAPMTRTFCAFLRTEMPALAASYLSFWRRLRTSSAWVAEPLGGYDLCQDLPPPAAHATLSSIRMV
jgi:hypothetical protein